MKDIFCKRCESTSNLTLYIRVTRGEKDTIALCDKCVERATRKTFSIRLSHFFHILFVNFFLFRVKAEHIIRSKLSDVKFFLTKKIQTIYNHSLFLISFLTIFLFCSIGLSAYFDIAFSFPYLYFFPFSLVLIIPIRFFQLVIKHIDYHYETDPGQEIR